jgi:DeoR/GlpR family transcriptional regulator of sugar metabolism
VQNDSLLLQERQARILDLLRNDGRVLAPELARSLGVSEDTVRRDLRGLARAGLCRRVYGGALLPAPDASPLPARIAARSEERQRLARAAANLVEPGNVVFIDAGSTNVAIAEALPDQMPITLVTNSPAVALACEPRTLPRLLWNMTSGSSHSGTAPGAVLTRPASASHRRFGILG